METAQCPICSNELEVREVTPCIECGALEEEVEILKNDLKEKDNYHHQPLSPEFNLYRVFDKYEITLCNFCAVDSSSKEPQYFGLPKNKKIGYEKLQFLKKIIEPTLGKDKYCSECNQRLSYSNFLISVRNDNAL